MSIKRLKIIKTSTNMSSYTTLVTISLLLLLRIGNLNMILAGKTAPTGQEKTHGQRFAMEPQDQTAVVGTRVTLPCRVIDKQGMLQWTKDDFGLGTHRNLSAFERYSMVGSDEEGDYSLDINSVSLEDDAKYQCQVGPGPNGEPGIRSRFASLTVLVPPKKPVITQGDFLVTTEDREIELECISASGKPAAEITWIDGLGNVLTKGIEYVKEQNNINHRLTTAKSILKLTPKKEHHNTTFTCQAQNTADRTYRSAKLKLEVKYAPKVSVSVIGGALAGGRIPEGAEVRLSCHADANPNDLTYRWYVNDELLVGDYTTEMIIANVSRKYHDAIVKCEVHNAVGKSEESETLDISYGPIFKSMPKSVEADLNKPATLTCDVDGNPTPDVVWIYDPLDRVVERSPNLTVKVTESTAGRYYCKASVQGFPEIGAEAIVYLKSAPRMTSQNKQFGISGDNARLECTAFSVPKARHVSWTFNGREINTSNDQDYSILEDQLAEGIKSTLIIRESQSKHFGKYNCTVVNDYGNAVQEIELLAQSKTETMPILIFVVVGLVFAALLIIVAMFSILYCKKGKKKLPPADVIPEHHISEKGCKESDRSSNISDLKVDIRAGSCEPDYSETCSGSESIATRLAANILGSTGGGMGGGGGGGGVPLAGPVKIPGDYRYSGDYTETMAHLQLKSGQNNNGYVPYVDYSRDYSPPPQNLATLRSNHNNSNTHPNGLINTTQMNGQLPSGNLSLNRNRQQDIRQDNGLPNVQGSLHSIQNGLLVQPLLQNGLSIDPRYSATYGNPYLRTSNASLPPLPPPSTANPAATPAPPPYNAARNQSNMSGVIGVSGANSPQISSPSGQFILPANGNIKKGALATHV